MIYEYFCTDCNRLTDVEKSLSELDRLEFCPKCDLQMHRQISARISFKGEKADSNEAFFSHALGQVVRNEKHQRELAKQRGLVEVGNEKSGMDAQKPQPKDYTLSHNDYHEVMGVGEVRSLND